MSSWVDESEARMQRIHDAAAFDYPVAVPAPPIDYGPRYDVTITLSVYPRDTPGVRDHRSSVVARVRKWLRQAEAFDHVDVKDVVRKTFPY